MQQHLCFGRISYSQMLVTTVFWLTSIKLQHSHNSHQTCVFFNPGEALTEILCWNTLVNIQRRFFNQERDESNVHVIITELAAFLWKFWLMEAKNAVWSLVLDTIPQWHSLPIKSTFPGAPNSEVLQQLLLCMCTCFVHFSLLREQNYRSKKMTNLLVTKLWCFTF